MAIMELDAFWAVIAWARKGVDGPETSDGVEEVAERVAERLVELGPEAAVAFTLRYDQLEDESYTWALWGAAYLMKGGCSDDAFDYFRGWLVAQGRTAWERAVADPDSLADLALDPDDDFLECEDMLSVGDAAFDDEEDFYAALDAARPDKGEREPELGESWDFDDDAEMRRRYPRLTAIYLED